MQKRHRISIIKFESILTNKYGNAYKRADSSIIAPLSAGSTRQNVINYYETGNERGAIATYYKFDRYGILFF